MKMTDDRDDHGIQTRIVSCLFLGIPYIFYEHTRLSSRIMDEESGIRYATPTPVFGACTCLVVLPIHLPPFKKPTLRCRCFL
jgi:hypothetical protein